MRSTTEARHLINNGFLGNGCGNSRWTTLLGVVLQWWANVDFSQACLYHDAERACLLDSKEHRLSSDADFKVNLDFCCSRIKYAKYSSRAYKVARLFHWAVILNSEKTYKESKQFNSENIL